MTDYKNPYSKFRYDNGIGKMKTRLDSTGRKQDAFGTGLRGAAGKHAEKSLLNNTGDVSSMMELTGKVVVDNVYESEQVNLVDDSWVSGVKAKFFKLFRL